MRARWRWVVGGAVVAGTIAVLALVVLAPRAPFRFLEGHSPISGTKTPIYTFQAEEPVLLPIVREELVQRGYMMPPRTISGVQLFLSERGSVTIYFDTVWTGEFDEPLLPGQPGWVTVVIEGPPPPQSLLARFQTMLGL